MSQCSCSQQIMAKGRSNQHPVTSSSQQDGAGSKSVGQVSIGQLLRIILPQLDKDRATQLRALHLKFINKKDISTDHFIQTMRSIIGGQLLRVAVTRLQNEATTRSHASADQNQLESDALGRQRQTSSASSVMDHPKDLQKIQASEAAKKAESKKLCDSLSSLPTVVPQASPSFTRNTLPGSLAAPTIIKPTTVSGNKRPYSSSIVDLVGDKRPVVKEAHVAMEASANLWRNLNMEQLGKSMGVEQLSRMRSGLNEMTQAMIDMAKDLETTKKAYEEKAQKMKDSNTQLCLSCDHHRKAATDAERERNKMGLALEAYKKRAEKLENEVVSLKQQLVDARASLETTEENGYAPDISEELTGEQKDNVIREFFRSRTLDGFKPHFDVKLLEKALGPDLGSPSENVPEPFSCFITEQELVMACPSADNEIDENPAASQTVYY